MAMNDELYYRTMEELCEELRNDAISELSDDELKASIDKMVRLRVRELGGTLKTAARMADEVYSSFRGYERIDGLLEDDEVTEIMVNRYDTIFIEKKGRIERIRPGFSSAERYEDVLRRIASAAGKELHLRKPIVDCRFVDGSRVNIVIEPIASPGSCLTIRRFRRRRFSLDELVLGGSLTEEAAEFLRNAVACRLNLFLSGGTGSGKTTVLNALAALIPQSERVITIEDARELDLFGRENWISLEAKEANYMGEGGVAIRDLIRTSLRMRPDRIIVGEVRGEEAIDMLQAMNTGHDGSLSTGHANSARDMVARLETMALSADSGLPSAAIRRQIASAVDLILHLERSKDGERRIMEIGEVDFDDGEVVVRPLWATRIEKGKKELYRTEVHMKRTAKLEKLGIAPPPASGASHAPRG